MSKTRSKSADQACCQRIVEGEPDRLGRSDRQGAARFGDIHRAPSERRHAQGVKADPGCRRRHRGCHDDKPAARQAGHRRRNRRRQDRHSGRQAALKEDDGRGETPAARKRSARRSPFSPRSQAPTGAVNAPGHPCAGNAWQTKAAVAEPRRSGGGTAELPAELDAGRTKHAADQYRLRAKHARSSTPCKPEARSTWHEPNPRPRRGELPENRSAEIAHPVVQSRTSEPRPPGPTTTTADSQHNATGAPHTRPCPPHPTRANALPTDPPAGAAPGHRAGTSQPPETGRARRQSPERGRGERRRRRAPPPVGARSTVKDPTDGGNRTAQLTAQATAATATATAGDIAAAP